MKDQMKIMNTVENSRKKSIKKKLIEDNFAKEKIKEAIDRKKIKKKSSAIQKNDELKNIKDMKNTENIKSSTKSNNMLKDDKKIKNPGKIGQDKNIKHTEGEIKKEKRSLVAKKEAENIKSAPRKSGAKIPNKITEEKNASKNIPNKEVNKKNIKNGREIVFDVSSIAQQAAGVVATIGGTTILCTTVVGKHVESDFLPLSVHYIEKYSAANKMPGGYKKREAAPSDSEILITRAIDRCLRAIISPEFKNEIQVTIQVLSYDGYALEPLAIAAASLSLNLAHVSNKLIAASIISGENINKAVHRLSSVALQGHFLQAICDKKIIMLEFMGPVAEKSLLKSALKNSLENIFNMQEESARIANEILSQQKAALAKIGYVYDKMKYSLSEFNESQAKQIAEIANEYAPSYLETFAIKNQFEQRRKIELIEKNFKQQIEKLYSNQPELNAKKIEAKHILYKQVQHAFAQNLIDKKKRMDGRKFDEIRQIKMQTKFMPKLHGSALFSRGDTQALVSLTIAPYDQAQSVESLSGIHKENFLLHYNFLPYAVMEIGKIGSLSRREIGHGELARKAFLSQLPKHDSSIRIVSEITSSNGSSSMATVCSASLAMFDAGIALKSHVAGISIGLIELDNIKQNKFLSKFKKNYQLLVDINAIEDEFGAMDFKVAGTKDEITAMQLDIKNDGITTEIFQEALELASKQIKKIIVQMNDIIAQPNKMAYCAPVVIKIDPSKIRLVIGKGGSTINEITKEFRVKIDVDKSGKVIVSSGSENANEDIALAIERIRKIIE